MAIFWCIDYMGFGFFITRLVHVSVDFERIDLLYIIIFDCTSICICSLTGIIALHTTLLLFLVIE